MHSLLQYHCLGRQPIASYGHLWTTNEPFVYDVYHVNPHDLLLNFHMAMVQYPKTLGMHMIKHPQIPAMFRLI